MPSISITSRRIVIMVRLLISGRVREAFYLTSNRLKGLDLQHASIADLGLSASRSEMYSPSGGPLLARVVKGIGVPNGSRVLDLGCGKGSAMFTLGKFPFLEFVGVELSHELVRIAKVNALRLHLPPRFSFVCCDASLFTDYDRFTHLYMYNPFPSIVMQDVMRNVSDSLYKSPRRFIIIYKNPTCHDDILATNMFVVQNEFKFGLGLNDTFRVYVHNP
jgi:SAM-dependent methyltransferase